MRARTWIVGVAVAGALAATAALVASSCSAKKLSPFTGIEWTQESMLVRVQGEWYELISIHGIPASEIQAFARKRDPRFWMYQIGYQINAILADMGHPVGEQVDLKLLDRRTGKEIEIRGVPMTSENVDAIYDSWAHPRTTRAHATKAKDEFLPLTRRIEAGNEWSRQMLLPEAASEDLDEIEWRIENLYSYRDLKGVDYRGALDAVRIHLGEGISRGAFAVQLAKVLCLFGDGHTSVKGKNRLGFLPQAFAPFFALDFQEGIAAVTWNEDRQRPRLLSEEHPFLESIDGMPAESWMRAAEAIVPRGAPHFVRYHALSSLPRIEYLRAEMELPASDRVTLELRNQDGSSRKTETLTLRRDLPEPKAKAPVRWKKLEDGLGYLRIARMDDEEENLEALEQALEELRGVEGVVIDVRDNPGGSRDLLQQILPRFLPPTIPLRVVNVASYRIPPGSPADEAEGYLRNRNLFPLTASVWSPDELKFLEEFSRGFTPEWAPPAKEFSAWHYFVIRRHEDPAKRFEGRPVALLQNSGCFSATDIFLGGFYGLPNAVSLGEPSGGGSGRARPYKLRHSEIEFQLSSMASYLPSGKLYDLNGVPPDILLKPSLKDFREEKDTLLLRAVEELRRRVGPSKAPK